jgi:hypothetical protein
LQFKKTLLILSAMNILHGPKEQAKELQKLPAVKPYLPNYNFWNQEEAAWA